MRQWFRWLPLGLLLAVLVLSLPVTAGAAGKDPQVWISADGSLSPDAIAWYKSDSQYYFFLPAQLNLENMRFGMADVDELSFSGHGKVTGGDSASFLREGDWTVKLNGKQVKLHVLRGSEGNASIHITTQSGKLSYIESNKEHREAGYLVFVGPQGDIQYDGELEHIKARGNSSMTFVKKNYQIKLAAGANLMGYGKAKKWILTGNYRDKSHLRNQIMYDLAEYAGMPYTPQHCFAEVYINHEYRGLYLFSEKVEIENDRIDIADLEKATEKLNGGDLSGFKRVGSAKPVRKKFKAYAIPEDPEDITGGYLIEFESYEVRYKQEASVYYSKKGNVLVIKSPEYVSKAQMTYISGKLQAFENAIFAKNGKDPDTGLYYWEIMDLESLTVKYMLEELCKNYDGNSSSQYFFKPADSQDTKIYAGPVWDYDSSFGSYAQKRNAANVLSGKGMWIGNNDQYLWYPQLYRRKDFKEQVYRYWKERMKPGVEILLGKREAVEGGLCAIDTYAERIRDSVGMDAVRWPRPAKPSTVAQTGQTFDTNITYLKNFLTTRYDYLCGIWDKE